MPEKKPLLLLPGMMCDARLFAPQIAALSSICDIRVGDIGGYETMEAIATALLAEAPWPRFAVCGLSMGGIAAMALAAAEPRRIERLALLGTNFLADLPGRRPVRDRQIAEAESGGMRAVIVEEMKPQYLAERSRDDPRLPNLLVSMADALGPKVFVNQSKALRDRPSYSETLADFRGPVLALCGKEDQICPPERHRQIANLCPDAELVVLPEAGHITTLEQPQAVSEALRAWLARPADPAF